MSKFWRAALVSAVAAGATAVVWHYLVRWSEIALQAGEGVGGADLVRPRSREDMVDALSEDEKAQLLSELSGHV